MTVPAAESTMPPILRQHLARRVGGVPADAGVLVIANPRNALPGWDGHPPLVTGVADPAGRTAVALPPAEAARAAELLHGRAPGSPLNGSRMLASLVGRPTHTVERVTFRWSVQPADLPDAGVWVDAGSSALPQWLRPFGGQALVAFDKKGGYLAGVGIKRHDQFGHEISVGTSPHARGLGLARRLVAQAARHILDQGLIPTYLHALDNIASSRVASAAGFPDLGWSALQLSA
jgi:ribosomal protein S18 acetylase RimI-like enzyme